MTASSSDINMESLDDLSASYTVGEPMTFEQMTKAREAEQTIHNPFIEMQEKNPYVFEDKPFGNRRFALISLVGPGLPQQHRDGKTFLKIKGATTSMNQAKNLANALHEKEEKKYGIYLTELFKFVCLPPPPSADPPMTPEAIDEAMNDAIRTCYENFDKDRDDFKTRKKTMLDDIKRQNEITKRIADGELPPEAAESESILPETFVKTSNDDDPAPDESMEKDPATSNEHFVALATLTCALPWAENGLIYKICGVFETQAQAESHMINLKKSTKYKLFDITVAEMYSWLEMPPPYEIIDTVQYDSTKLTEALGARKQKIEIDHCGMQEPADLS